MAEIGEPPPGPVPMEVGNIMKEEQGPLENPYRWRPRDIRSAQPLTTLSLQQVTKHIIRICTPAVKPCPSALCNKLCAINKKLFPAQPFAGGTCQSLPGGGDSHGDKSVKAAQFGPNRTPALIDSIHRIGEPGAEAMDTSALVSDIQVETTSKHSHSIDFVCNISGSAQNTELRFPCSLPAPVSELLFANIFHIEDELSVSATDRPLTVKERGKCLELFSRSDMCPLREVRAKNVSMTEEELRKVLVAQKLVSLSLDSVSVPDDSGLTPSSGAQKPTFLIDKVIGDITRMDRSPLSNLHTLSISNMALSTLELLHLLSMIRLNFKVLRRLELVSMGLTNGLFLHCVDKLSAADLEGDEDMGGEVPKWRAVTASAGLEYVNLSENKFFTSVEPLSDLPHLKVLILQGTRVRIYPPTQPYAAADCEMLDPDVTYFPELECLDLSTTSRGQLDQPNLNGAHFLSFAHCLPRLSWLDVSAHTAPADHMVKFLDAHPRLKFLGLAGTDACYHERFADDTKESFDQSIMTTGFASIRELKNMLQAYSERAPYVEKALSELFLILDTNETRPDLVEVVLQAMERHQTSSSVHISGTACLFNLSVKDSGGKGLHIGQIGQVAAQTLVSIKAFGGDTNLQKNCLLILCNDRILHEAPFDRFKCCKLVMDTLCQLPQNDGIERMCVAVVSILAAKITTDQTGEIGSNPRYVRALLDCIKSKVDRKVINVSLKFALSALWNLTDESPSACERFLDADGLPIYMKCAEVFKNAEATERAQVDVKIAGLLNNIAEVADLRKLLLTGHKVIQKIRSMLKSYSDNIEVAYFAGGILCNVLSDLPSDTKVRCGAWESTDALVQTSGEILEDLYSEMLAWKRPDHEMVAYRSFRPFYPLMDDKAPRAGQYWAMWAINNVCHKSPDRYLPMLEEEGGIVHVDTLHKTSSHVDPQVKILVVQFLDLVIEWKSRRAAICSSSPIKKL